MAIFTLVNDFNKQYVLILNEKNTQRKLKETQRYGAYSKCVLITRNIPLHVNITHFIVRCEQVLVFPSIL